MAATSVGDSKDLKTNRIEGATRLRGLRARCVFRARDHAASMGYGRPVLVIPSHVWPYWYLMKLLDQLKAVLRGLLIRATLLLAGCAALAIAIEINLNAGNEILSGLLSPDAPADIVVSVARLLAPVLGLWLIYRGLR